jgi:hypothetical protein
MVKFVGFVRRKEELTYEEFLKRWDEHVSVVDKLPDIVKYTQSVSVAPAGMRPQPRPRSNRRLDR